MKTIFSAFRRDEGGSVLVQYLLVLAGFAVAAIGGVIALSGSLSDVSGKATGYNEVIASRKLTAPVVDETPDNTNGSTGGTDGGTAGGTDGGTAGGTDGGTAGGTDGGTAGTPAKGKADPPSDKGGKTK